VKSENLKGFRWIENTKFAPMTAGEACVALGIQTPLMSGFEMDDPTAIGKRDRNIDYIVHAGKVWKTVWMDRSGNFGARKKKAYGVLEIPGAPISEFV
jgi:hypothetical protein